MSSYYNAASRRVRDLVPVIAVVISFMGLFAAATLSLGYVLDLPVPCGGSNGCASVAAHSSSKLLGVPIAFFGVATYLDHLVADSDCANHLGAAFADGDYGNRGHNERGIARVCAVGDSGHLPMVRGFGHCHGSFVCALTLYLSQRKKSARNPHWHGVVAEHGNCLCLTGPQFGVSGVLADPVLGLFDHAPTNRSSGLHRVFLVNQAIRR
jgi:hypothetical protein